MNKYILIGLDSKGETRIVKVEADSQRNAVINSKKEFDKFYPIQVVLEEKPAPTDKQLSYLLSVDIKLPEIISKDIASQMIENHKSNEKIPMTDKQKTFISQLGGEVMSTMTKHNASKFIEYLLEHRISCNKCGSNIDFTKKHCGCGAFIPNIKPIKPSKDLIRVRTSNIKSMFAKLFEL